MPTGGSLVKALPRLRTEGEGWPWDVDRGLSGPVQELPGGWPRITVVTPSFNQAAFLEETLRSVLLQGYPNLEYIVVDGGSTDGSREVLEAYAHLLDWWVSEKDGGQADAINKGFRKATGEIRAYLNSDDVYVPGTLLRVARDMTAAGCAAWHSYAVEDVWPDGRRVIQTAPWIDARAERYRSDPKVRGELFENDELNTSILLSWLLECVRAHQPGTFWWAGQHEAVGGFDEKLHFGFDQKFFWGLLSRGYRPVFHVGSPAARFRWHPGSKSSNAEINGEENRFAAELQEAALEFLPFLAPAVRPIVRGRFLDYRLSVIWGRYDADRDRAKALRSLWGLFERVPSSIGNRFFVGSARRFALGPRR